MCRHNPELVHKKLDPEKFQHSSHLLNFLSHKFTIFFCFYLRSRVLVDFVNIWPYLVDIPWCLGNSMLISCLEDIYGPF